MEYLGSLFDDDIETNGISGRKVTFSSDTPPLPRPANNLCGIYNQGATCYLNALLQTLFFIKDFRESVISIDPKELGNLTDKDNPHAKVRVIPIYLQRLFAEMMLLDEKAVSTTDLTDSFGWNDNEQLEQHDVQELNRIFFAAIEESLVGLPSQDMLQSLFKGATVNQIECRHCHSISSRSEDFLDLCVSVLGPKDLISALNSMYLDKEELVGNNKYSCDSCHEKMDADKGCKIKHLPKILTISLLRFNFDCNKMERYKETGKFTFPHTINFSPYLATPSDPEEYEYELISVVIHSGSTYGGHYTAYIKDVNGLGVWTDPRDGGWSMPGDSSGGNLEYKQVTSARDLLKEILLKSPFYEMTSEKLLKEIEAQTGCSWKKHFRRKHGTWQAFLKKNSDYFILEPDCSIVRLTNKVVNGSAAVNDAEKSTPPSSNGSSVDEDSCWFSFNDSHVLSINSTDIESQFSGKESAYMLFYRQKNLHCNEEQDDITFNMHDDLLEYISKKNSKLQDDRDSYKMKMNTITVQVHFEKFYYMEDGGLKCDNKEESFVKVKVDKHSTVEEFKKLIPQDRLPKFFVINIARELPVGLHLYERLKDEKTLADCGVHNRTKLFLWSGYNVNGSVMKPGQEYEPVFLYITHNQKDVYTGGFPMNATLQQFEASVAQITKIPFTKMSLYRVKTERSLSDEYPQDTLRTLGFTDHEEVVIKKFGSGSPLPIISTPKSDDLTVNSNGMTVYVNNHCTEEGGKFSLDIELDQTIEQLKVLCMEESDFDRRDHCRLRMEQATELGPPIIENTVVGSLLSDGCCLTFEKGPSVKQHQLYLTFTLESGAKCVELVVDAFISVKGCLCLALKEFGLSGSDWHLCKADWFGEPDTKLDDLDAGLSQCDITHGDQLIVRKGQLPPKGFIRLKPYLLPYTMVDTDVTFPLYFKDICQKGNDFVELSPILMRKDLTLGHMKDNILADTVFEDYKDQHPVNKNQLRIRLMENGRPTKVLRANKLPIHNLKIVNDMNLAVQLLPTLEELHDHELLLAVQVRCVPEREYLEPQDVIWDCSNGATSQSLYHAISARVGYPAEEFIVAKHFPLKYSWMPIELTSDYTSKTKKTHKANLRKQPFHLTDSDVLGVKVSAHDPNERDDFDTKTDRIGIEVQRQEQEAKRKLREENRQAQSPTDKPTRRPENAIKINVADFR